MCTQRFLTVHTHFLISSVKGDLFLHTSRARSPAIVAERELREDKGVKKLRKYRYPWKIENCSGK